MGLFLLFVDGFGLGAPDPLTNPAVSARLPHLTALFGGAPGVAFELPAREGRGSICVRTDPRLGVRGLPQSATGQTTILTGVNAPRVVRRHINAHPTPTLVTLLHEHSLFKRAVALGARATFLNAYGPPFFAWYRRAREAGAPIGSRVVPSPEFAAVGRRRYRPSATTVAVAAAGLPFRDFAMMLRGEAVFHDIDRATLAEGGFSVPRITPEEAGRQAAAVGRAHDLTMFEHFLTDIAGHRADLEHARAALERLDRFTGALLAGLDPAADLLVLCSDHGNIEDCGVRTHTLHDVATVAWGRGRQDFVAGLSDLTHVAPAALRWLARHARSARPRRERFGGRTHV